ncbi:MAG: MSEP-CTERM sorting domain-containing protein, partial [Clostridiales bacterium]|nr:MSEP-CTERM sorting domain-containing protein [Clostridiales bacterium]
MKNVFNPIYNLLLNMAAYASLGTLLFLEFGEPFFFAAGLAVSVFLFFLHGLYLKKTPDVTKAQHFVFMLAAIVLLFALLLYDALTVKRSDHFLLILTLASLSPLYNFCGYVRFTRIDENTSLLKYALGILLVPFTAFLIYNHYTGSNYKTIYMIVIVAAYYFVLFSLIKIIALVIKEKNLAAAVFSQPNANRLMTVFLALVLPLTGLILNQYLYNGSSAYAKQMGYEFLTAEGGFAGDFSHPVFYALTLLNGCCLLIPLLKYEKVKLLVFYCKAFGYPFILYMAVAFLPVLPVGVMALCFLVGFYAFVPLALAVWQGKKLLADYRFLKNAYQKNYARAVLILAVLTLPFLLTAGFIYDKINYEKALVYAEQYHTEATETIDIPALERTLAAQYAGSYQRRLFNTTIHSYYSYGNIPLISKAYELTVFGGQELSRDCRRTLQALFLDAGWYNGIADQTESLQGLDHYTAHNAPVTVSDVRHTTRYDETIDAYRTWVDLDLKNSSAHNNEFQTVFDLPDGVYVSDYSLYVGKEKKMGLLTDRRAALSIYSSIVRSQLDPGILHYIDDDSLELRVFPFLPNETRQTGFELIHKNNFALNIGGVGLTVSPAQGFTAVELPNAVLLSGEAIEKLPPLNRALDYYFILDCSADSDVETLSDRISSYAAIND